MLKHRSVSFAIALAGGLALAATAVAAGPAGKGKAKEHGQKDHDADVSIGVSVTIGGDARGIIQDYYRANRPGCPPGLAKKHNGCLPPGQAKKSYEIGHALPGGVVLRPLPRDLEVRLPAPLHGHIYAEVDGDVLLIAEATKKVIDAVVILSGL